MELLTIRAGWGRNRRFEIKDGNVQIQRNGPGKDTTLRIKDGHIVEIKDTEEPARNSCSRIVTTKAWKGSIKTKTGTVKTTRRYDAYSNLPSEGMFYEVAGLKIGRHKGTLRQISRQARFVREEFEYDNSRIAYVWTPYRKRFQAFRPNGKLWMEMTAKIRRPYRRSKDLLEKTQAILNDIAGDGDRWSNQANYEIRLFDGQEKEYGYGKMENHQRAGIWRHGKARYYYMMGVSVKKETYYAGPDELDPREVLKTENMQLRAALMKKIGPERLLQKLPFTICHADQENQLLKADLQRIFKMDDKGVQRIREMNQLDEQIAIVILKCPSTGQLYYLRVPPRLNKVEHARQWLCGIDIEGIEEEYIRDSWMRQADGRSRELSPSQQETMKDEIEQAKQREKLEFVSEA